MRILGMYRNSGTSNPINPSIIIIIVKSLYLLLYAKYIHKINAEKAMITFTVSWNSLPVFRAIKYASIPIEYAVNNLYESYERITII